MSEVEKQVPINNEIHTYGPDTSGERSASSSDGSGPQTDIPAGQQQQNSPNNPFAVKIKRVGKVSSLLYQTIGGICLAVTCLVTLLRLFFLLSGGTSWVELFVYPILLVVFYLMVRRGVEQRNRLQRAERYFELCDYKAYGKIETLARGIAKSRSFVIKDLQKMIALGIYPEGHLDEENTCIMLNDMVYQQYLEKKIIEKTS